YGAYPASRESSGTSWQPDSSPLEGVHFNAGEWMMMADAWVNVIYDKQEGKRGDQETFSTSMFMFMAHRPLAQGTFGLRSMLSLDPLMGKKGYPLLLQNGETGDGRTPLVDRQHAHDLFMELAATYSHPLSEKSSVFTYFGLPGEPALGPPAFMHRFSGRDFPGSPITHHWLDSTHITYGVFTAGYVWGNLKFEASSFTGREPNENRWDIERPRFDSAAGRVSFNPSRDLSLQASFGYLKSPEQLEPGVDMRRTTVSAIYNKRSPQSNWQVTFAWGRNDKIPGKAFDGFLLETALELRNTHILLGRFERVAKDELFPREDDPLHGENFKVNKLTLGYIYNFPLWKHMRWGIGGTFDINIIPAKMRQAYGNTPVGYMLFARLELG
ncbi:MAG: hypothetical protein WC478_04975, partial [Candidatus Omnitrophota bacterium]